MSDVPSFDKMSHFVLIIIKTQEIVAPEKKRSSWAGSFYCSRRKKKLSTVDNTGDHRSIELSLEINCPQLEGSMAKSERRNFHTNIDKNDRKPVPRSQKLILHFLERNYASFHIYNTIFFFQNRTLNIPEGIIQF